MLNHRDIGKAGYLHNLCEVLKSIGQEGDAVIVGRGARYILPEQFGLRVRLVAPRDIRIRCIEKELGATREEARFIVN